MISDDSRQFSIPRADALVMQANRLNIPASSLLQSVLTLGSVKHRPRVNVERIGNRN